MTDTQTDARPDYVEYRGLRLPPPHMRFCTTDWQEDAFFLESAVSEVDRLRDLAGLETGSRLLDIGSGQGRLAIGLAHALPGLHAYWGVDVSQPSVEWCRRNIQAFRPNFQFLFTDFSNDRYSPNGVTFRPPLQLPFADSSFDVIFLYSVFTHMDAGDVSAYLAEVARLLRPGGRMLCTVYVENDVADVEENPAGYLEDLGVSKGALHRVRFERGYLEGLMAAAGLEVAEFLYRSETVTRQSVYVLRRG